MPYLPGKAAEGDIYMYIINKAKNSITKVDKKSFSELGFKEREHLQEWLAKNPEALGEELLIIQKEFNGFNDTNERLDLLALDKQGNLVVIENKLDDSGKDVTWQVLKYASYCSTLSKNQIKDIYQLYLDKQDTNNDALKNLVDFFGCEDYKEISLNSGQTQRIILVAANYRKEVTSTVLWLMNYKLRIQCFKITPYALNDQLLLDIEQIIPMKDTEEYVISMAEKTQDNINTQEELKASSITRMDFWKELLKQAAGKVKLFQNISATKDNWISAGSGISGISYNFVASRIYARTEVLMQRPSIEENKMLFDELHKIKSEIEDNFGGQLTWERLEEKKACRIKSELEGVNVLDKDNWAEMIDFMINSMIRMEKALNEPLKKAALLLKK